MSKFTYGYEVSTQGDRRFSALVARMPDGRTIEEGKGKPPLRSRAAKSGYRLCDRFASTPVNQARALATILNGE